MLKNTFQTKKCVIYSRKQRRRDAGTGEEGANDMKVTMKQIAEIAGVHRSTVDKVIHGRPGVSDDVRKKVQKIIDELEYKPNMVGMALKSQSKVFRLAAILLDVDAMPYLREGIARGAEEYRDFNIELQYEICKFSEPQEQARLIREAVQKGCDGIILSPINAGVVRDAVNRAADKGVPTITVNSDLTDSRRLCTVDQDNDREGTHRRTADGKLPARTGENRGRHGGERGRKQQLRRKKSGNTFCIADFRTVSGD